MSLNRIVSGNKIPERLNRDILRCKSPVICVGSSSLTPQTMRCGDRMDAEGIALCDHHNAMIMEHQVLIHDGVASTSDDCMIAIKPIDEPKEDSSYCARLGRFIRNNKLLVAGALTLTGAIYLLSKASSNNRANHFSNDDTPSNDGEIHQRSKRLIGGSPVDKGSTVRAVYVHVRVGEQGATDCTGSALSEDTILTAAHCVTMVEPSADQICKFSNGTVISTEEYNKLKEASSNVYDYSYSNEDYSYSETLDVAVDSGFGDQAPSEAEYSDNLSILQDITCKPAFNKVIEIPAQNVTVLHGTERSIGSVKTKFYAQKHKVEHIVRHPDFNITQGDTVNDIALIKLQKPIKGIPLSILPTNQANAAFRAEVKANHDLASARHPDNLYLQGWGKKENPDADAASDDIFSADKKLTIPTERLLEANLTAVKQIVGQDCDAVICSKGSGKEICIGDSGGPVFYQDKATGDMYQVGVNSKSSVSCTSGESLHVDVFGHKEWIEQRMKEIGSATTIHMDGLYAAQATKEFNDVWDGYSTEITQVDCDAGKIARLKAENQRQQQKATECAANLASGDNQMCDERQARAAVYQSEVDFRNRKCNTEPNNGKGMILRERFELTIGQEPKLESCFITNHNNKDVLAFTPEGNPRQKINVLPNQTVPCPKDNGFTSTEGRVTRPLDQDKARGESQAQHSPLVRVSNVFISAEKEALAGEEFQPAKCHIVNTGSKILKFKLDDSSKHIRVMPESEIRCDRYNSKVPSGKLLDPYVEDFPLQAFTVLERPDGRMRVTLTANLAVDVLEKDKAFLFDDKHYMEPTSVIDLGNMSKEAVFVFGSTLPHPTTLRLVDKTKL